MGGGHPAPPHPFILQNCVFIGGPRAIAGHRKYSGIYWKNFTSDHVLKVSIFSQHLLRHKAGLFVYHTHCACVHLMRPSSIHFRMMAAVQPSYKYIDDVCPVFSVGISWWYINVNYCKLFFNSILELISV